MALILLKTLKNTSFIIFFSEKKYIQCFLFIVWWKQWNKQKIIKKLTFSVKINFFHEIAYIPFFWTKIKMVFLRYAVTSPRNAGNGIIYASFREKIELQWKDNIFLAFSFIFIQNKEMKGKKHWKILFLKEINIFSLKWLELHFMEHGKEIFFKMLLKQIKRFKKGSLCNFKEKNNTL